MSPLAEGLLDNREKGREKLTQLILGQLKEILEIHFECKSIQCHEPEIESIKGAWENLSAFYSNRHSHCHSGGYLACWPQLFRKLGNHMSAKERHGLAHSVGEHRQDRAPGKQEMPGHAAGIEQSFLENSVRCK